MPLAPWGEMSISRNPYLPVFPQQPQSNFAQIFRFPPTLHTYKFFSFSHIHSINASAPPSKSKIRYTNSSTQFSHPVLSGDSILLVGKPRPDGKPPNERILSLANVSAPRFKRDGDEVCPWLFALTLAVCICLEGILAEAPCGEGCPVFGFVHRFDHGATS